MSLPLVSIVGRPNVGKSTVFNRIIKKRKAIVDDIPGVTRDRNIHKTDWNGIDFMLNDTGGYVPNTEKKIEKEVKEQVDESIRNSSLILFVLDVKTGITDLDQKIGKLLLKSGRKIIPVINKVDNNMLEIDADEFYRLGLGELYKISALNGRNIGDLLDCITESFADEDINLSTEGDEKEIKIAVVGKRNVGKSSFVNAVLGEKRMVVSDIPGTTRDSVDSLLQYKDSVIRLIDTAGLRKQQKITESIEYYSSLRTYNTIDRCDVAVVFVDALEGITKYDMQILDYCEKKLKGIVLIFNKWDLASKREEYYKTLLQESNDKLKTMNYIPMLTTSVLNNTRISGVLDMCIMVFNERSKRIDTSDFNDLLQELVKKNPPSHHMGKKVDLKFGVQVSNSPPVFLFFVNIIDGIKNNYKRYIEKEIRNSFGFEGVSFVIKFKKKK